MARDPSISSHGQPSDAALAERPTSSGKAVESVSAPDTDQPDHAQSHSPASSALDASQDPLQHQATYNDDAATSEQVAPLAATSEPTSVTTDPAAGQPADPTINRDEGGHEEFWQRDAAAWEAFDRAAFRLTAYESVEEVDDEWEDESEVESEHESEAAVPAAPDDAALRAAAVAAFPPPIAHPPLDDEIEVGVAADADDPEAEIGLAEEMDGILEAIGMRGPLFGIVQNLFLMIFLCAFVMLASSSSPTSSEGRSAPVPGSSAFSPPPSSCCATSPTRSSTRSSPLAQTASGPSSQAPSVWRRRSRTSLWLCSMRLPSLRRSLQRAGSADSLPARSGLQPRRKTSVSQPRPRRVQLQRCSCAFCPTA